MALGGSSSGGGSGSASPNAIKAGEAFVELSANDSKLQKALNGVVNKIKRASVIMRQVGLGAAAAGLTILAPLIGATKTFAAFDDTMRTVKAVVGANADEFERLNNLAKNLGQTTSFTANQVAGLMVELGKAGFSVEEIEGMTASILNLSRASGTDATLSAEIFGSTMRQFGLTTKDSQRIVDVLTASANKSAISVSDLGESFKYAGPVLADLNLSLEDSAALVGVLGNLGIKGSDAGTALRRLGIILSSQPEKIKKAFNVDTLDAQGNLRPIVDILDEIFNATNNMGTGERAKALGDIFGMLTITSASALSKNAMGIREFAEELKNANGVAASTAKEMDAGIGGALRRLRGGIEGIIIALGDSLAPTLIEMGEYFQPLLKQFLDLIKSNKETVVTIGIFAAAITAGGLALAAFGFAISGVLAGLGALKAILLVIFSPFILKIALVTAAIVGLGYLLTRLAGTSQLLGPMFSAMGETFQQTWSGILAAIKAGDLSKAGEIAWLGLKIVWKEGILFLIRTWEGLKVAFSEIFIGLIQILKEQWQAFIKWMVSSLIDTVGAILRELGKFSSTMKTVAMAFDIAKENMKAGVKSFGASANAEFDKTIDDLIRRAKSGTDTWSQAQAALLEQMKAHLKELTKALPVPVGPEVAPMPREIKRAQEQAKLNTNLQMLADSVRGTFGSSNYAGAFGIGGKNELEKQTNLLKSIDKKLDKLDVPVWE